MFMFVTKNIFSKGTPKLPTRSRVWGTFRNVNPWTPSFCWVSSSLSSSKSLHPTLSVESYRHDHSLLKIPVLRVFSLSSPIPGRYRGPSSLLITDRSLRVWLRPTGDPHSSLPSTQSPRPLFWLNPFETNLSLLSIPDYPFRLLFLLNLWQKCLTKVLNCPV